MLHFIGRRDHREVCSGNVHCDQISHECLLTVKKSHNNRWLHYLFYFSLFMIYLLLILTSNISNEFRVNYLFKNSFIGHMIH